jgi:glycosyltransferase involved in cell wall biosynthesis
VLLPHSSGIPPALPQVKIAILFDNFGPYHVARLEAANRVCTLLAVQAKERSCDYAWEPVAGPFGFKSSTLSQNSSRRCSSIFKQYRQLRHVLADFAPNCVFIPGWSRWYSLASLFWCRANGVPIVIMSESTEHDAPRSIWKEWFKRQIVSRCSTALVGGSAHAQYVIKLGMVPEQIFKGYDVVDNEYFYRASKSMRQCAVELCGKFALPRHYFLAAARFVAKKNLDGLVKAYALYVRRFECLHHAAKGVADGQPWSLVLLGDGPERSVIHKLVSRRHLESFVFLPGFAQYAMLPVYFGLASAFVHASISEPWGLVVNEAMASGLPVLVSKQCGCVSDLVRAGRNGFTFDARDANELAELMLKISADPPLRERMSKANREIISCWSPRRFADGLMAAAQAAIRRSREGRRYFTESCFSGF